MDWLNLHLPILRSPEFLGSEPVERATWLCLMAYCVDQENGGVIKGCADWGDRKWQQLVGVTAQEVTLKSELWQWGEEGLIITFYPKEKQDLIKARREAGRKGGKAGVVQPEVPTRSKRKARAELNKAVQKGQIERPKACPVCQESAETVGTIEGHHHDYAQPLNVTWACRKCHGRLDAEAVREANAKQTRNMARTEGEGEGEREVEGEVEVEKEVPPIGGAGGEVPPIELQKAKSQAELWKVPGDVVEAWFDSREACGWVNGKGHPIRKWDADLRGFHRSWVANRPTNGSNGHANGSSNGKRPQHEIRADILAGVLEPEVSKNVRPWTSRVGPQAKAQGWNQCPQRIRERVVAELEDEGVNFLPRG